MIFSRFFTPAHASENPQTRIESIAKLSPDSINEKRILHELAFNDDNREVSLAALEKLNSFALWQKMSQIASDAQVKQRAQKWVNEAILSDTADISERERTDFLLNSASSDLVHSVLMQGQDLTQHTQLVIQLLDKVGRQATVVHVCLNYDNSELASQIITSTQDVDLLQKIAKKAADEALVQLANQRIAAIDIAKQKPIQIEKDVTLILAKIKALLDKSDFPSVEAQFNELSQSFMKASREFDCLDPQLATSFKDKAEALSTRIQGHLARLKPHWHEQEKAQLRESLLAEVKNKVEQLRSELDVLFEHKLFSATLADVQNVVEISQEAEAVVTALKEHKHVDVRFSEQLTQCQRALDSFPACQQQAQKLQVIVEQAEALFDKQDPEQILATKNEWDLLQTQWRDLTDAMPSLPENLLSRWKKLKSQWRDLNQQRKAEQQQHLKHCRKHLNIIGSMVEQGKFRGAMARFTRLEQDFSTLPESSQALLQRRFDQTKEQISRLEGWQSYLAAPRKPALLEDAKRLLSESADDIPARVRQIKYLRKQWQSLGATDDAEDNALNQAFDEALEHAFEPCRLFFAEQEKQRETAKSERQMLIQQLEVLDLTQQPEDVYKASETLKQAWRNAGQVDRTAYAELRAQWDSALASVMVVVNQWHQENRAAKQTLIDKAKQLNQAQDDNNAVASAQQLQAQWKEIGHAGRRYEGRLWQQFKQANDDIFAQAKANRVAQRQSEKTELDAFIDKVTQLAQTAKTAPIGEVSVQLDGLQDEWKNLQRTLKNTKTTGVDGKLKGIAKTLNVRIAEAEQRKLDLHLGALINLLANWTESQLADQVEDGKYWAEIPRVWQQAIANGQGNADLRHQLTVELEILLGLDSPEQDYSLRQTRQLALLTAKMEQGEAASVDELVLQWLGCGPLTSEQQRFQDRFERIVRHALER